MKRLIQGRSTILDNNHFRDRMSRLNVGYENEKDDSSNTISNPPKTQREGDDNPKEKKALILNQTQKSHPRQKIKRRRRLDTVLIG